jgi:flagellar biosynthetic protein FliQ
VDHEPIMETELAELVRQAVVTGLVVAAPVLVVGFVVGTLTGLVQAATGVHEAILGFVPRVVAMAATLLVTLPWMVERLVEFLRQSAGGS